MSTLHIIVSFKNRKAPITKKVVCFCFLEAFWSNSVDPDQTAPIWAV